MIAHCKCFLNFLINYSPLAKFCWSTIYHMSTIWTATIDLSKEQPIYTDSSIFQKLQSIFHLKVIIINFQPVGPTFVNFYFSKLSQISINHEFLQEKR